MFNYLKKIFYNSNLDFLNVKDIIWAKRYDLEEEKELIKEGHRKSPYIVIYKSRKKVYGLECTSNKSSKAISLLKLKCRSNSNNNLYKDGYIFVGKLVLLNRNRFIKKMGVLDDSDLNRIYKSIYLINKRYKNKRVECFPKRKLKFYFDIGDIVLFNERLFYIDDMDDKYFYIKSVYVTKKGKITLNINDISYTIDFGGKMKVLKTSKLELMNITDDDMQEKIQNCMEKFKIKCKNANILNRGKLILINGNYYYVYGEFKNDLLLYKIYLDRDSDNSMYRIVIDSGVYYTLFEEEKININERVKILRSASQSEMDDIKNIKNNIKKSFKEKAEPNVMLFNSFMPGFIMLEYETLDRYIIIERKGNKIVYARLREMNEYFELNFEKIDDIVFEVIEKLDVFKFKEILNEYNSRNNEVEDSKA